MSVPKKTVSCGDLVGCSAFCAVRRSSSALRLHGRRRERRGGRRGSRGRGGSDPGADATGRKAVTDSSGRYTFATLTPGDYDIRIVAPGFKAFAKQHVPVTLNSVTRIDAALEVGAVTETVEVNAAAPPLQTDRADVRHDITAETLEKVPLPPGNNFESLFVTIPGVNPPTTAHSIPTNPSRALQFNVNGTSEYGNDIHIDGVSQFIFGPPKCGVHTVFGCHRGSQRGHGQFQSRSGPGGRSTVNVQIKSGKNNVHGTSTSTITTTTWRPTTSSIRRTTLRPFPRTSSTSSAAALAGRSRKTSCSTSAT